MAHWFINNVDQAEQNGELDQHRETSRHRIVVLLLIELHHLFIETFFIIPIFFLKFLHSGAEHLHLNHRLLLLNRKRHQKNTHNQGKQDQRNGVDRDHLIAGPHNPAKRPANDQINQLHLFLFPLFSIFCGLKQGKHLRYVVNSPRMKRMAL